MSVKCLPSAALAATLVVLCAGAGEVRVSQVDASISYREARVGFCPQAFAVGWHQAHPKTGLKAWDSCGLSVPFSMTVAKGDEKDAPTLNGRAIYGLAPDGGVTANWVMTPDREGTVELVYVNAELAMSDYAGGTYALDGKTSAIPEPGKIFNFGNAKVRRLDVADARGARGFTLLFDQPTWIVFQDNTRFSGSTYSLRIHFAQTHLKPGDFLSMGLTLRGKDALVLKPRQPVTLKASSEWLPFTVEPFIEKGSALDFSAMRGTDAPAGKHGRVIAKGGHFEFEGLPGVAQRFYGVNICFTANFTEKPDADRIAAHLARIGYNAVRFHHHDHGISAGKDRTALDPARTKQFDGLVAACVDNGLYMTTDLFVSRRVPWRAIGEDRDGDVPMQEFKELVQAHEGAYRNYIAFARSFLEHVNAYTGRRNADEPALAWLSLVNEGNLGNRNMAYMPNHPCFAEKYGAWLAAKKAAEPGKWERASGKLPANLYNDKDFNVIAYELFLQDLEMKFAARVTKFLREEIRSKQLTTNMNCWHYPTTLQLPRAESYDYVDDHFYVDHPRFLDRPWSLPSSCPNANPMANVSLGVQDLAFRRIVDRPFTITEYNYSGPGRYRGVGGIACGALAALQGWSGLWRFAWSHDDVGVKTPERKALTYFDMAGDPLGLASERASICLFLRRDLEELKPVYAAALPRTKLTDPAAGLHQNRCTWNWAGWYAKIGNVVADAVPAPGRSAGDYPASLSRPKDLVKKDLADLPMGGGAITVDGTEGTMRIDTARTCGVFGEPGRYEAGALACEIEGTLATVWVSSLDGRPIADSKRLLLTHLTDVQDTDIRYADDEFKILLAWGHLPHLMRAGKAKVSVRVAGTGYAVYVLGTDGRRRRRAAADCRDGRLTFTADIGAEPSTASYLYEIVAE